MKAIHHPIQDHPKTNDTMVIATVSGCPRASAIIVGRRHPNTTKTPDPQYSAVIELIAQPYHELMLYRYLTEHNQAFEDAILVKFSVPARRVRDAVMEDLTRMEAIEILNTDKVTSYCVRLSVREKLRTDVISPKQMKEVETQYIAIKEGGGWKLLRPITHDILMHSIVPKTST
jgi:hypothetical protein